LRRAASDFGPKSRFSNLAHGRLDAALSGDQAQRPSDNWAQIIGQLGARASRFANGIKVFPDG
jgi:hypothetical protein